MSETPRILLFADAGALVGGGHVMRCLSLAEALRRRGAVCAFIETPAARQVLDAFADPAIERLAPPDGPPDRLAAGIADLGRGWGAHGVVIDHYGFAPAHEAVARGAARRLLSIDDLRREHLCDLLLDSNLDRSASDYTGLDSLIGPHFALVRRAFAERRVEVLNQRAERRGVRRLLVALGLTDVGGVTGRVVEALLPVLGDRTVDVATGRGAESLDRLKALAERDRRLTLHVDAQDMAALTAGADLAIGAGGSSLWERCCLGLPSVALVLADNQRDAVNALAARGAAIALEADDRDFPVRLAAVIEGLFSDAQAPARMSAAAGALCDGLGAERVADRFLMCMDRPV